MIKAFFDVDVHGHGHGHDPRKKEENGRIIGEILCKICFLSY